MAKIAGKKIERKYLILFESIILTMTSILILTASIMLWGFLKNITNNLMYAIILITVTIFALYSTAKNRQFKKSKPRANMILHQAYFKEQVPMELKPILDLVYYPFFRAMNAEEYRNLEIDEDFYRRMRKANINLEQNLSRSSK